MKEKKEEQQKEVSTILPYRIEEPKKIVCEVCGYANPEYTAICKKCSNYLQRS